MANNSISQSNTRQGDSIEVEFGYEPSKNQNENLADDSKLQLNEDVDDDSIFNSLAEEHRSKTGENEKQVIRHARHVIHGESQSTAGNIITKLKSNDVSDTIRIVSVDTERRQPPNELPRRGRRVSQKYIPSCQRRISTILEELDGRSETVSYSTTDTGRDGESNDSNTSCSSNDMGIDYTNSLDVSLGSISFPAGPLMPLSTYLPTFEKPTQSRYRKFTFDANDEISAIDDGGCGGPSIPEILDAFTPSEYVCNPLIRPGHHEARKRLDLAREQSLVSTTSSTCSSADQHSTSSVSIDVPKTGIPTSISTTTQTLPETNVVERFVPTNTSNEIDANENQNEYNNRKSRMALLWKLPMLSFSYSYSTQPSKGEIKKKTSMTGSSTEAGRQSEATADSRSILTSKTEDTKVHDSLRPQADLPPSGSSVAETILDDELEIEACITKIKVLNERNSIPVTTSNLQEGIPSCSEFKCLPSSTNATTPLFDEESQASTEFDSFKGDDDEFDQSSINTSNWASKVQKEIERIVALVTEYDDENKSIDSGSKSQVESYTDVSMHQSETTSEIRESRQSKSFPKPRSILDEKQLLDGSNSSTASTLLRQYHPPIQKKPNKRRIGSRFRMLFGRWWKSRHSSSSTSNDTNSYIRTDGTTRTGATIRMTNPPTLPKAALDTALPNTFYHSTEDANETGIALLLSNDHISKKYIYVDRNLKESDHSGMTSKSWLRRPRWFV